VTKKSATKKAAGSKTTARKSVASKVGVGERPATDSSERASEDDGEVG